MDNDTVSSIFSFNKSCIIAPAGFGKTESICDLVNASNRKVLILTHTHAGIDSIKTRLTYKKISSGKYNLKTIASFTQNYVKSFPFLSQLPPDTRLDDWDTFYKCMHNLIKSSIICNILTQSYERIIVDEYQDCTIEQHKIINTLSEYLPLTILGDPLQAIFDFGKNNIVDWDKEIIPTFSLFNTLKTPWRWEKANNLLLGNWLQETRRNLEKNIPIDMRTSPSCVNWIQIDKDIIRHQINLYTVCNKIFFDNLQDRILVVYSQANQCHNHAKKSKGKYISIEVMEANDLKKAAKTIEDSQGEQRVQKIIEYISQFMTGAKGIIEKIKFKNDKYYSRSYPKIAQILTDIRFNNNINHLLPLLEVLPTIKINGHIFRPEMYYEMKKALKLVIDNPTLTLTESITHIRNQTSIIGRYNSKRIIARTLLVKGLEYEHVIICNAASLDKKNLYVALTRATKTITIFANSHVLTPVN